MAEVGPPVSNQATITESSESNITNNFSLASLNEIEKKLVEQSFEQAADLQNLKIQCEENERIINNLRSDITKSHLGLEKLDDLYNAELGRREEVKDVVNASKKLYEELVDMVGNIEKNVNISSLLVNNMALHNDTPENTIAADIAINKQINNLISTTSSTLKDLSDSNQNMAALEVASKEMSYLITEKNELVNGIISLVEENRMLEEELLVMDDSSVELDGAKRAREVVAQEVEELKTDCDGLVSERTFVKNEIDLITQDIQLKDHCLKVNENQTKQIDIEISIKENIIDDINAEIEIIKNKIADSETPSAANDLKMLEAEIRERNNVLTSLEESVEIMTKQYTAFKDTIANIIVEENELSIKSGTLVENISFLHKTISQCEINKNNAAAEMSLLEKSVSEAQAELDSATEKLNLIIKENEILACELSTLLESSEQLNLITKENEILASELNNLLKSSEQVRDGNNKLSSINDNLLDAESELLIRKEEVSASIKALELKVLNLKVDDVDMIALEDTQRGAKLLEDLKSGISVWKEGMESAINDLAEQKIEREANLRKKLISLEDLLEDAKIKVISNDIIDDLKKQDAELVSEIQNQEEEKVRLMAQLKGTQDQITVTVNLNSNLPLSQSSTPALSKTTTNEQKNMPQAAIRSKSTYCRLPVREDDSKKRRRLYNPPAVSSTVGLNSDE